MERLTGKGVKSLKESYAKVYIEEQIQVPDYTSMSDEEFNKLVQKSGNPEGVIAKRLQQRKVAANEKARANYTAADAKADRERAKTEAENKRRKSRGESPLPVPQGSKTRETTNTTNTRSTDQNKVRAEYDRLRYSKDSKERAQSVTYGKQMAAAGAAKKNFSGYQSAADAKKNLPAPAQKTSIADQLKQLRSMRANPEARQPPLNPKINQPVNQAQKDAAAKLDPATLKRYNMDPNEVKPAITPNQQSSLNSTVQSAAVPIGNTIKTTVNPDSSMRVTQKRTPEATKKITQALTLSQSVDLFDIVKGEFIEEGYSEEDTMYMMANLNEEQLQEFLKQLAGFAIRNANKIPAVKGLVTKAGRMFGRSPKPTAVKSAISQRASNVVKDQRAGVSGTMDDLNQLQQSAQSTLDRVNRSTSASAARTAAREKTRLNNLNPRAVSDRNAREAAAQVRQRNVEKGRPSFAGPQPVDRLNYKPGDPQFTDHLKRYYASSRAGDKGLPK